MIVTSTALFRVAYGRFAIGAYNINNMEQALGLFRGHMLADAPFIVQVSKGARTYAGTPMMGVFAYPPKKVYYTNSEGSSG
jgi:fructose-bisphosphate aldolase class II